MNYYDESGHQIGYSTEALFGGRNYYDENGHHVGYSTEALFGGENFYCYRHPELTRNSRAVVSTSRVFLS
jgi:hypothetical protein